MILLSFRGKIPRAIAYGAKTKAEWNVFLITEEDMNLSLYPPVNSFQQTDTSPPERAI
jgi:hypothetical protein